MIELTEEQARALDDRQASPPRFVHPRTGEAFVSLRIEDYERLKDEEYDDSPWTRDEIQAAAWERARRAGHEGADEYDGRAEQS